jgi:hypothetical protein
VTIAHGESAGAASVASINLDDVGWTGWSNLSGSIGGDLAGDLLVQESAGQGGLASFIIGGGVYRNVTIPSVDTLRVGGVVGPYAMITISDMVGDKSVMFTGAGDFAGDLSFPNGLPWAGAVVSIQGLLTDAASVDLNGQELAGQLSLYGGSAGDSEINAGPLTRSIGLFNGEYRGSVTVASIEEGWGTGIFVSGADLFGSINVLGDCKGWLGLTDYGEFDPDGLISVGGDLASTGWLYFNSDSTPGVMAGDVLIGQDCDGLIQVGGYYASPVEGRIDITGDLAGTIEVDGVAGSGLISVSGSHDGLINVDGDISGTVELMSGGGGTVDGGSASVLGLVSLSKGASPYTGTATFQSIASSGQVAVYGADLSGTGKIHVIQNMEGIVAVTGPIGGPGGTVGQDATIQVDGDSSGGVQVFNDLIGKLWVNRHISGPVDIEGHVLALPGDIRGEILADADASGSGDITGNVTVDGIFDGNICGGNLAPRHALPPNIQLSFGPAGKVCGALPCIVAAAPEPEVLPPPWELVNVKNRSLSITAGAPGRSQAIRVTALALPVPFNIWNGQEFYAGEPRQYCENAGMGSTSDPTSPCGSAPGVYANGQDWFWGATLYCDQGSAHFMDWTTLANYSLAMPMTQAGYGDVVLNVADCPNGPPDGSVGVVTDVQAILNKFSNLPCAVQKARADLVPCVVDFNVGIPDVVAALGAFNGNDYEDSCGSGQCSELGLCKGGPDHGTPCTSDDDCSSDVCESGGEAAAGGGAMAGSTPTAGATAALSLTTSEATVKLGETIDVHVFASGVEDLRAYQVKLTVDGGTEGELTLGDLRIDTDRADYVFSGLKEVHAADLSGSRIGGALVSGGVDALAPVYLGTYTFQTSAGAAGVFSVTVDSTSGASVLMDSKSMPMPFAAPSALMVSVGETE